MRFVGDVAIRSFTVKEVAQQAETLASYANPHGHVPSPLGPYNDLLQTNPARLAGDLALVLALDNDRAVGRLGFYAGRALCHGEHHRVLWLDGFFLDPAYHETGVGGMLLMRALSTRMGLLASGGPSEETQKVYRRAGFRELPPLQRFLFFYRPRVLAEKALGKGIPARLVSAIAHPFFSTIPRLPMLLSDGVREMELRRVAAFDAALDELPIAPSLNRFPRDAATLNWALTARPLFAMQAYHREELLGYALLQLRHARGGGFHNLPEMTIGRLLDYSLGSHHDNKATRRTLLTSCIRFLAKRGADVFECQVNDPEMKAACRSLWMVSLGGHKVFYRPAPGQRLSQDANWFLTHATSDSLITS